MAKPFYSMEEICQTLGKSPDEIRQLVRDGVLREFRDAGKIFFKAEDVDQLAGGAKSDTGEVLLEPAEETAESPDDGMPSLTSSSGGTSIIGLEPIEEEETQEEEEKEDTVITASGIGVFDDDELEIDADPMAKTQITEGAVDDQVALESSGSGSGLLDLTRESTIRRSAPSCSTKSTLVKRKPPNPRRPPKRRRGRGRGGRGSRARAQRRGWQGSAGAGRGCHGRSCGGHLLRLPGRVGDSAGRGRGRGWRRVAGLPARLCPPADGQLLDLYGRVRWRRASVRRHRVVRGPRDFGPAARLIAEAASAVMESGDLAQAGGGRSVVAGFQGPVSSG